MLNRENTQLVLSDFSLLANEKVKKALDEFCEQVKISMAIEPTLEFVRESQTNEEMLSLMRAFLVSAT